MMRRMVGDTLVEQLSDLIDQYSAEQHVLALRLEAVRRARTELRLGRSQAVVLSLLQDELGEPMDTGIGQTPAAPALSPVEAARKPEPATAGVLISLALRR